jgi:ATP-dependent protease HslVU (ClpYQ) peptidase subunit
MTFILGSKCKDGVVLIADRKVSFSTGDSRYQSKLYRKGSVVFGCAGPISGLADLRNKIISTVEGFHKSEDNAILKSQIEMLAQDVNIELKNAKAREHEVLVCIQVPNKSAAYCYYPDGSFDPVDNYKAIGSGEPYGSVFLKLLWNENTTMEDIEMLGFFIIKYIEGLELNDLVGVGEYHPQIYFIPDRGEIHEAAQDLLDRFETSSRDKIERSRNYIVEAYRNGPATHSLETFLSEISESDIEVAYEIYSWQQSMPEINFRDGYTESDFIDIKGWSNIREKWKKRDAEFRSAVERLSRLGLLRFVPNTRPEYTGDRYIITRLMVSLMDFNKVISKESEKKWRAH